MIWGNQARIARIAPEHEHHDHELVIALNSQGWQAIRQIRYPAQIGQAWFLPSRVPHHIHAEPDAPISIFYVCFPPGWFASHSQPALEEMVQGWTASEAFAPRLDHDVRRVLVGLATQLELELKRSDPLSHEMAKALLVRMLLLIHRQSQAPAQKRRSAEAKRLEELCDAILAHPDRDITLATSAAQVGMSRSSFTEAFRTHTGKSLIAYVLTARITEACHRLALTDQAVSDIALGVGFHNLGHFHTIFKRETGLPPLRYRQKVDRQGAYHAITW